MPNIMSFELRYIF